MRQKKIMVGFGAAIPLILLLVYVLNRPLPAPSIDQRAHPLAIKLVNEFPELKNLGDDPDKARVSWDIAEVEARTVVTFRIANIGSTERQDRIQRYLAARIESEPFSQIDLIFYWKDAARVRQHREERIDAKKPAPPRGNGS